VAEAALAAPSAPVALALLLFLASCERVEVEVGQLQWLPYEKKREVSNERNVGKFELQRTVK
jgi:hypothetical protein